MDHVEKLTDGPLGVGTRWMATWKSAPKPVEFDVRPHGPMRLFFPLVLRKLRKGEAANMQYVRAVLAP